MPSRFRLRAVLFLTIIAGALCNAVRADNWERIRGPNGTGVAKDKNIPVEFGESKNLRWKTAIPGLGHSSPIVWGDRVFLQSSSPDGSERSLYCFDANTGKEVWKRSIK